MKLNTEFPPLKYSIYIIEALRLLDEIGIEYLSI